MASQKEIYGNYVVLDPEDNILFKANSKRVNWYLDNGLARIVSEEPTVIKLNFKPNGPGCKDDKFALHPKENICVACGTHENLTQHHVIPHSFKKYYPKRYRENTSHDVLILCVDCHRNYESEAYKYKNSLFNELGINWKNNPNIARAKLYAELKGAANTLLKYDDSLPDDVKERLFIKLKEYTNQSKIPRRQLLKFSELPTEVIYDVGEKPEEQVIEALGIYELNVRWRRHFVNHMNPEFLPKFWDINRGLEFNRPEPEENKPRYIVAAEKQAELKDCSIQEVLDDDLERLKNGS